MKAITIVLALALCFVGIAVCVAEDAFMGTWKLNEAKSKFGPGASRITTVVYEAAGENVKVTVDGIGNDGKPTHNEWTGKFDGKDYPVSHRCPLPSRSHPPLQKAELSTLRTSGTF